MVAASRASDDWCSAVVEVCMCCRYVSLAELGVLQVDRVTTGDHGTYRCTATNDVRQRHSADARLTVLTAAATTGLSVSQSVHLSRSHQPTAALSLEVTLGIKCTRRGGSAGLRWVLLKK